MDQLVHTSERGQSTGNDRLGRDRRPSARRIGSWSAGATCTEYHGGASDVPMRAGQSPRLVPRATGATVRALKVGGDDLLLLMRELVRDVVRGTLGPSKWALGVGSHDTRLHAGAEQESPLNSCTNVQEERPARANSDRHGRAKQLRRPDPTRDGSPGEPITNLLLLAHQGCVWPSKVATGITNVSRTA